MPKREMFNRGDPTVTAAGAANFIADHVKPNHSRRETYRDAHQRIKRAQQDGALPDGAAINTDLLFGWALEHSDWQDLRTIPWLPRSVQVEVAGSDRNQGAA